jgi:hypothetical protein
VRTQESWLLCQIRNDRALVPDVVAAGKNIDFSLKEFVGYLRSQSKTCGSVFHVGDAEINAVRLNQALQIFEKGSSSRLAENISNKQNAHIKFLSRPYPSGEGTQTGQKKGPRAAV